MALILSELSREAKNEYIRKRMEEMELKNKAYRQRHAEVEQDRINAEAKGSAVTSLKVSKKGNIAIEKKKVGDIPKITKEREWDKGKINYWGPQKFHGYRSSERIMDAKQLTNTKDTSALLNILFSVHERYKKCLEVYGPIAQKSEMLYSHYRTIFDTVADKRFLHFLSGKLIKITQSMISIQESFEKIDKELQFIYVIIDNCLTSAVEFFFESAIRILRTLSSVNDLMSKCVNELEAIDDRVEKPKAKK